MVDMSLLDEAQDLLSDAVSLRRQIHARPELGLELPHTQELVLAALDGLGLDITTGRDTTSVVAVLDGGCPGPTTLLRGDMDALPMPEDTGLEFASEIDGAMHACGHDAHVAMLVGAASLLAGRRRELPGRVMFMFQPGEEGHAGASIMLGEGLLERHGPVDRAFAIHTAPNFLAGTVATRAGTLLASADAFTMTISGKGGHASMPHDAIDPIPVACELVVAIQAMITRRVSAFDPAVVTVGSIRAGTAGNIIPETVDTMWGTDLTTTIIGEGQVAVFIAIDHCSAECVGIHAAQRATRFEALEPIRQGVRDHFGGFARNIARGLAVRHDHGSQYMADAFQNELAFLGIESSPAFVRAPEGNGCAERFIRTLKENLLWVRTFDTIEDLRQALLAFRDTYNTTWLIERHGFLTPAAFRQQQLQPAARAA